MTECKLEIRTAEGAIRATDCGEAYAGLYFTEAYQEGDQIVLRASEYPVHAVIQVDDAMGEALVYLTGEMVYQIPFGEKRVSYSPKVFAGDRHYLFMRVAREDEIKVYRNLAKNVCDQQQEANCYPHAHANVETRGEAVFAARNAIDGVCENRSHGEYPYQSWGINMQDDAEMSISFGRPVEADKIVMYTRADFPHDNWWVQVSLDFSDGSTMTWDLEKSVAPHVLTFEPKQIEWIRLYNLIKADDPSPFPALSQMEVYGREI